MLQQYFGDKYSFLLIELIPFVKKACNFSLPYILLQMWNNVVKGMRTSWYLKYGTQQWRLRVNHGLDSTYNKRPVITDTRFTAALEQMYDLLTDKWQKHTYTNLTLWYKMPPLMYRKTIGQ